MVLPSIPTTDNRLSVSNLPFNIIINVDLLLSKTFLDVRPVFVRQNTRPMSSCGDTFYSRKPSEINTLI